jgi:hypothetical protein
MNPFLRFHVKLQRTAKALRQWAKSLIGNNGILLCAAKQLIGVLDVVQDYRQLSPAEVQLKRDLKVKFLGLTAIEKLRARQRSRLLSVRAAEANTKLFYLQANSRRRKNHIHQIVTDQGTLYSHEGKAAFILNHFSSSLGQPAEREFALNWEDLHSIHGRHEISFDCVPAALVENPNKAIRAWRLFRRNVHHYCLQLFQHDQHFTLINNAHIILLPKRDDAKFVTDYRPISLSHSAGKVISKLLATRLAGELNQLVSRAQSAFIKKRSIHDNFLYTQNIIKELNRVGLPTLFLKLDIAKAFDTVRWDSLLEVLDRMGFGCRWKSWISTLLASASSTVLLNGTRGRWFKHRTGLRQGDPLSPMLFILAMEPLQLMLNKATTDGLLTPINSRKARLRTSLFADDAAILLNPVRQEVETVKAILTSFGAASGLLTNTQKSTVYPIRCEGLSLQHIMETFQCPIKSFPCTYLGLPLHTRQLRRVDIQPLIDKAGARLTTWKGKLLNKAGRLRLISTVLTSLPTYHLTVFSLQKWAIKKIDKLRRGFLWKGSDEAKGGHCLVQWARCLRPKKLGGLGILDLDFFSRALRLRWMWFQWTEPDRSWVGTEHPMNAVDRQLFRGSTVVTLGDGANASFWQSAWLDGLAPWTFSRISSNLLGERTCQ